MTDSLTEAVAKIKPGDTVTVRHGYPGGLDARTTGTVESISFGSLWLGGLRLRYSDRQPGDYIREVIEHTPAPPPEPPVYSVRRDSRDLDWTHRRHGFWACLDRHTSADLDWEMLLQRGPLTDPTAVES